MRAQDIRGPEYPQEVAPSLGRIRLATPLREWLDKAVALR